MEFHPVRLEDKAAIEKYTRPSGICNCDLAFANMYCWEGTYRSAWCIEDGFLLIRFYIDGSHHIGYMQPLGAGDFTHLIPRLEADARQFGQPLRLSGLTREGAEAVRRAHPEFGIWRNRDYEDYVYNAVDLRTLAGRKYQPKRNHINRFEAMYEYRYEPLTPALIPECMRLEREWRSQHEGHRTELTAEQRAMQRAFDHFEELELQGGALYVGETLVAFTFGSAINDHAFCVHVEKADTEYDGAFTIINKCFAEHLPARFAHLIHQIAAGLALGAQLDALGGPAFHHLGGAGAPLGVEPVRRKAPGGKAGPAALFGAEKQAVGQPPRAQGGPQAFLEFLVSGDLLQHQTFSNRSTLVTKMVAPPTVTCSG